MESELENRCTIFGRSESKKEEKIRLISLHKAENKNVVAIRNYGRKNKPNI